MNQPDIAALRQKIERLWRLYLSPDITPRQRRQIGWRIDQLFNESRNCPEWMDVFLATDAWWDE